MSYFKQWFASAVHEVGCNFIMKPERQLHQSMRNEMRIPMILNLRINSYKVGFL